MDDTSKRLCDNYITLIRENQRLKVEIDKLTEELQFTRQYIRDNGLEFDLLSKWNRRVDND